MTAATMDLIYALVGLGLLVAGGDALVRGAVALSLRLGIPALVVSLTVVAFGTSAPELLIAVQAALEDAPGLAFGNVVGSNIANVLLVLGAPAVIAPFCAQDPETRRSFLMMMGATLLFIALCFYGPLNWWGGAILLACLAAILSDSYIGAMRARAAGKAIELEEIDDVDPHMAPWKIGALLGAGLIGLPLGANFLIDGARGIAISAGISEAAIGLTLVAIGTSLPELVTTIMAALRRHAEVAFGNVIGSNIFNILGIMGVTAFFGPLEIEREFLVFDFWAMLATSALIWMFVYPRVTASRPLGFAFLALYIAYGYMVLVPKM